MASRFKSLCRVVLWAIAMTGPSLAGASSDPMEQNVARHENWIRGCTESRIAVVQRDLLVLYAVESGADADEVVQCLLSGRNPTFPNGGGEGAEHHPSPFDVALFDDGSGSGIFEALIQTDTRVVVVSSPASVGGIEKIGFVSGFAYVAQTSHHTHVRSHLGFADSAELAYLTNGVVEILDREALTFRVHDRKSYFRELGAFWLDAVIDQHGNILDVVTSSGDCMSRRQLARESTLDLSRVLRAEVCINR